MINTETLHKPTPQLEETLHKALLNSFEDFVEPFNVSTETVNVHADLLTAAKALRDDAFYNDKFSWDVWRNFNAAIAAFEEKKDD
jgi:hypothetical protein